MSLISVVTPVFNETDCLREFLRRLSGATRDITDARFEFVFVDDGSTDGSFELLRELAAGDPRIRVIRFARNFGAYVAMHAGLRECSGDAAVLISADLQDPPELIADLVETWRAGTPVIWAVRRSRQDPLWRRVAGGMFHRGFRLLAMKAHPKEGHDFCLVDRAVIDVVKHIHEKNTSVFGLIRWTDFPSNAISYDREARFAGESGWTVRKMMKLAADSIFSFSPFPVRLSFWFALIIGFGLLIYMAAVIYGKVSGAFPTPPGWPSLMTVILFTSGLQLLVMAILGEYLWRALEQIRGRPSYIVSEKIGFEDRRQ